MAVSRNKQSVNLPTRVADFFATRLCSDEPLALGLSGGCDSIVLLHLLHRVALPQPVHALHVHHGLSANADKWADFCLDACKELDIPCHVLPVTVHHRRGTGLEAAARLARYQAFADSGFKSIVLAHHAGDQAETLLFNLFRGTGLSGMTGMPAERMINGVRILRPLLAVSRQEIEAYAQEAQLNWVTDESNADRRFSRNFIRHEVLPAIRQHFPAVEQSLLQAAGHFSEADSLLAELAEADWGQVNASDGASMRGLRQLSFPRLKNLLRYRLRCLAWRTPETSRLDEFARQLLQAAPDRHPQLDLPDGCMRVQGGVLHWIARK